MEEECLLLRSGHAWADASVNVESDEGGLTHPGKAAIDATFALGGLLVVKDAGIEEMRS
jgi:hypothetical protein